MTDMIMFPEDPEAPRPSWPPRQIGGRLRNEKQADWLFDDDLTVRYDADKDDIEPVGVATLNQLAGYEFLRVDPQPPRRVTQDSLIAQAAIYERKADVYDSMLSSMEYARRNAIGNDRGETGAMLAALWAGIQGMLNRKKGSDLRKQAAELGH